MPSPSQCLSSTLSFIFECHFSYLILPWHSWVFVYLSVLLPLLLLPVLLWVFSLCKGLSLKIYFSISCSSLHRVQLLQTLSCFKFQIYKIMSRQLCENQISRDAGTVTQGTWFMCRFLDFPPSETWLQLVWGGVCKAAALASALWWCGCRQHRVALGEICWEVHLTNQSDCVLGLHHF